MLGRFGLSGHHHLTPICKLSGGQKARVVFTSISLMQPHILLLDGKCGGGGPQGTCGRYLEQPVSCAPCSRGMGEGLEQA